MAPTEFELCPCTTTGGPFSSFNSSRREVVRSVKISISCGVIFAVTQAKNDNKGRSLEGLKICILYTTRRVGQMLELCGCPSIWSVGKMLVKGYNQKEVLGIINSPRQVNYWSRGPKLKLWWCYPTAYSGHAIVVNWAHGFTIR
jgi:phosphoribosyl-AMP cyclohydrolase